MDPDRFDALAVSLARSGSRRRLLSGLVAGALAPLTAAAHARRAADHGPGPASCLANGRRCSLPAVESDPSDHRRRGAKAKGARHGKHHAPSCANCCSRFGAAGSDGKARCACKADGADCANPSQCCGGLCHAGVCTSCPGALTVCAGACVDLQTNDAHCGDCGTQCADGQRCVGGTCVCDGTSCPRGCCAKDGSCQRGTDDAACGIGGAACQACQTCTACDGTTCAAQSAVCCGDTTVCANGVCTPCGADQRCRNGACECDPGLHLCAGRCVRDDDVAHCGTSCDPCPTSVCSPATCDGTTCGRAPIANCCENDAACGDSNGCTTDTCGADHTCVHTPNDGGACGIGGVCCGGNCCTAPSNASPTCAGETCGFACNAGFHVCAGACAADDDATQCGAACVACPTDPNGTATCVDGQCGIACKTGFALCGGACCGGCCASGTCVGGADNGACGTQGAACVACAACHHCDPVSHACVPDDDNTGCGGGKVCCGGACVDRTSDTANCGSCGNACPSGNACCSGKCADLAVDNVNCGACGTRCLGQDVVCKSSICCQANVGSASHCSDVLPCCLADIGAAQCTTDSHCCRTNGVGSCEADFQCCNGGQCVGGVCQASG